MDKSICKKCIYCSETLSCTNYPKDLKYSYVEGCEVPVDGSKEYYTPCIKLNANGNCTDFMII